MQGYDFVNFNSDGESLIHLINLLLGENIVGAEIGVENAKTFCSILQKCPRIKKLYGIDSYKPYIDYLNTGEDNPQYYIDEKSIEFIKLTAHHNILFSGLKEKAILIEKDSSEALNDFENESLDFIFIDSYMSYDQAVKDINQWYSKLKNGGIFSGHDSSSPSVQKAVNEFRSKNNITNFLSVSNNTWIWIK